MNYNKLRVTCILLIPILLCSCVMHEPDVYIFCNIEECNNIESHKSENAVLDVYHSPDEDKYSYGLSYNAFYGCNYVSDDYSFEIFAYTFSSMDEANKYFKNATGKDNPLVSNFLSTVGSFDDYRRVVVSANNAYLVRTKASDAEAVCNFLNSAFTQEILK